MWNQRDRIYWPMEPTRPIPEASTESNVPVFIRCHPSRILSLDLCKSQNKDKHLEVRVRSGLLYGFSAAESIDQYVSQAGSIFRTTEGLKNSLNYFSVFQCRCSSVQYFHCLLGGALHMDRTALVAIAACVFVFC